MTCIMALVLTNMEISTLLVSVKLYLTLVWIYSFQLLFGDPLGFICRLLAAAAAVGGTVPTYRPCRLLRNSLQGPGYSQTSVLILPPSKLNSVIFYHTQLLTNKPKFTHFLLLGFKPEMIPKDSHVTGMVASCSGGGWILGSYYGLVIWWIHNVVKSLGDGR